MLFRAFALPIPKSSISKSPAFQLLANLVDGVDPNEVNPELIKQVFNERLNPEVKHTGKLQINNFIFDFQPFLTKFLVKTKNKGHEVAYAISVEWVIKTSKNPDDIIEIKKID